jgi:Family of unknown function (DUF5752)
MEKVGEVFVFRQSVSILKSTGEKAATLRELRGKISKISEESIYHHTYQYFQKGHVREYTNDFAHWSGESLEERALSERLSNIDPYTYPDIDGLRRAILSVIDDHLEKFPEPREAMQKDEFHFTQTVTLVFPAGTRARNLAELLMAIKYVDSGSIYYHFYEARKRLGATMDDFTAWLEGTLDKKALASRIRAIDPFMHSIEGIREHIAAAIDEELKQDMELAGLER